jgi:hypothetical protein
MRLLTIIMAITAITITAQAAGPNPQPNAQISGSSTTSGSMTVVSGGLLRIATGGTFDATGATVTGITVSGSDLSISGTSEIHGGTFTIREGATVYAEVDSTWNLNTDVGMQGLHVGWIVDPSEATFFAYNDTVWVLNPTTVVEGYAGNLGGLWDGSAGYVAQSGTAHSLTDGTSTLTLNGPSSLLIAGVKFDLGFGLSLGQITADQEITPNYDAGNWQYFWLGGGSNSGTITIAAPTGSTIREGSLFTLVVWFADSSNYLVYLGNDTGIRIPETSCTVWPIALTAWRSYKIQLTYYSGTWVLTDFTGSAYESTD